MKEKLEDAVEYLKKHCLPMLFLGILGLGSFKVAGELIMQPKREQAMIAAYELALKNYNPSHTITIGDKVNEEVIDTVSETANLMRVYAEIDGKQMLVPLAMRTDYVANINGIPTEGKNGYNVEPGTVKLKY